MLVRIDTPESKPMSVVEPLILMRVFAWDPQSPAHWIISTCGLSLLRQAEDENTFRHVELTMLCNNQEVEDPIPARLGVGLHLPAFDWEQVEVPSLLQWFAGIARNIGTTIEQGETYGPRDGMDFGFGEKAWTASMLSRGVLMPVPVMLLAAGMGPFTSPNDNKNAVDADRWNTAYGQDRFSSGFLWWIPLSTDEYERMESESLGAVLADLLDAGSAEGDPMLYAANFLR
jgi:hypothetical protein